jgi:hypothetical protein
LLGFTTLALAVAAPVSATHCFVVKKPTGAGSGGTATFDLATHTFTAGQPLTFTPSGELKGAGFLTVTVVDGTTVLATADLFWHIALPDGAHESGPGTTECDGVGIDDIIACILAAP